METVLNAIETPLVDEMYDQALRNMEQCLGILSGRVRPPQAVARGDAYVFRYQEREAHQALVQKLARLVSGLHAARLLLARGFVQEMAAIQRTLDEFNEDIGFLAWSAILGVTTDLHRRYLEAFFQEEFDDPTSAIKSSQNREMIPRKKIRAYLAQRGAGFDPSTNTEIMRTIDKLYSGYVHGASPQIMEMYCETPPHFQVRGLLGSPLLEVHRDDLWNPFYRSISSFGLSAKAFGDDEMHANILEYMKSFARANGQDYSRPPTI
jgi:hypothetical protein